MRPIAPYQGRETVRTLLDSQRGITSPSTSAGSASRNVRPSPNTKASSSVKQLGGCIDLTDDDEKSSATKQTTAIRSVVQTSQILSPVVQTSALRGGTVLLPTGSSPVVLQPVTQGLQANVVYASAPNVVRPGVTVGGQVPQLRPGQIVLQQRSASNVVAVNRPPPPLKSAPGVQVLNFLKYMIHCS